MLDNKTVDIAGVRDVVLKTSFGTSWTLKDVRYIPVLKRWLILIGQLDEEGYPRRLWRPAHQRLGEMRRIVMNMFASKGNIPDVRKLWGYESSPGYPKQRYHICDSLYEANSAIDSSSLTKPTHKSQVVSVDIPKNLAENDSIVPEHGLSSKITQNQGKSLYISEGSKNSGSFRDSRSSDEEYSEDEASYKEGDSKTPQVRRSTRESRALSDNQQERRHHKACGCLGLKKTRMAAKAAEDLPLEQLDVKTAFLHSDHDEDIYMTKSK
nr:retrovirus-related Pol polyprotein from transposon TNT 1-94 [Tanacetum cinerariifolium]